MDEMEQAKEYLRARQEAEVASRVLNTARANYSPIVGALFPERRHQAEEAAWKVMDMRDDAQRRAEEIGWQMSAETKQIADEVFEQWKKEKR